MSVKKDPRRGTWFFVVDLPAVGGKRQQLKQRGFKTKKLAEEAEAAVVADRARGTFVRPVRVTLGAFLLDEWLPAKRAGLRPSTFNSYDRILQLYVAPTIGQTQLSAVDGSMLNALYARLLAEGRTATRRGPGAGLAPKTVRNVHGVLARAFRDAVRWGRLCGIRVTPRTRRMDRRRR